MPSELHAERRDATLVLTLSSPDSRNVLSDQVFTAGVEALEVAESNEEIRCVVLRGEGAHFCSGGNPNRLKEGREGKPGGQADMLARFHGFIEVLHTFPKPVIAAVEGVAAGGGFSLALACDLLVAARNASFTMSYGRIGLSPDGGASWQLMQRLPRNLALQMLWLPEPLSAEQLHAQGMINWLTEPGQALTQALAVATHLSSQASHVMGSVKELVNAWPQRSLMQQLDLERDQFLANLSHTNGAEDLQAFLKRRLNFVRAMNNLTLTPEEQSNIEAGSWFSKLSSELRNDILARAQVRRLPDSTLLSSRGAPADMWCGVAKGAVRVSSVSLSGKEITLTYVEPGIWFGDISLFDNFPRTHDSHAHGETTVLAVRKADFQELLAQHVELYDALLHLNCRRLRLMFDMIEDLNTRPLSARLAKQILLLARAYGVPQGEETRIGLQLAQEDIAQLLGASRQRVNQELKGFERDGAVRIEPTRLVVLSTDKLLAAAER